MTTGKVTNPQGDSLEIKAVELFFFGNFPEYPPPSTVLKNTIKKDSLNAMLSKEI